MRSRLTIAAASLAIIVGTAPMATPVFAQQPAQSEMPMQHGGMTGQGGMTMGQGRMMMGRGGMMMGQGGMMGGHDMMRRMHKMMMEGGFAARKKDYSIDDVKRIVDGRLARHGFSRLKVGEVKNGEQQGVKSALVDVVSPNGEFLFRFEVNRTNGSTKIVE